MHSDLDNTEQLLLCCANPFTDTAALQALLDAQPNWDRFLEASRDHRLLPLVYHHLSRVPASIVPQAVVETAKAAYMANAVRMEFLSARLDGICKLMSEHNIRALPWKGPSLARAVYADAALRPADDLDFLVHPDDMMKAIETLDLDGFTSRLSMSAGTRRNYLLSGNEYIMTDTHKQLFVELAPRPLPPPFTIRMPSKLLWPADEEPCPELHFLLLCIHGAKHSWDRLIWISDLCAFLEAHPTLSLPKLAQYARDIHAEVLLLAAMDLARSTGFPVPALDIEGAPHLPLTILIHNALNSAGISGIEETRRQIMVYSRKTDAIKHVARWLLAPTFSDWASLPLPPSLSLLYWILRPARLGATSLASAFKRKQTS